MQAVLDMTSALRDVSFAMALVNEPFDTCHSPLTALLVDVIKTVFIDKLGKCPQDSLYCTQNLIFL